MLNWLIFLLTPRMSESSEWSEDSISSDLSFDASTLKWVKPEVLTTFSVFNSPATMDKVVRTTAFTASGKDGKMVVDWCHPLEPICRQKSDPEGRDFFFIYKLVLHKFNIKFPLSSFICMVLSYLRAAPSQLHPNGWAFMRAFEILCGYHGITPTCSMFFYFFQ